MKKLFFTLLVIATSMISFADDHKEKKDVDMKKIKRLIKDVNQYNDIFIRGLNPDGTRSTRRINPTIQSPRGGFWARHP